MINFVASAVLALLMIAGGRPEAPPNIVLIIIDDLGWTDLGCYGSDFYETTNIDRLANQGVLFTQAYAAGPVCTPTRSSILTGQWPARTRMTDWNPGSVFPHARLVDPLHVQELPAAATTLAEALKGGGYTCLHVGKWHLGGEHSRPQDHGFDVNVGGSSIGAPATYWFPYQRLPGQRRDNTVRNLPPGGETGEYLTDRLTSEAIQLLRSNRERPFFLHLAYYAVHSPVESPPRLVSRYRAKEPANRRHRNVEYAAMIHSVDENIGRLMDALAELDLESNTVVVLVSDNGGATAVTDNRPLRAGKGSLFEGGIRIPFIVRWPKVIEPGRRSDALIQTIDLHCTLLDIAGITPAINAAMDGRSFVPVLRSDAVAVDRAQLFWHYPHYPPNANQDFAPSAAMREGKWKAVLFFEDSRIELYDLESDPGEQDNVSLAQPDRAERMRTSIIEWLKDAQAQLPTTNPAYDPSQPFRARSSASDSNSPPPPAE